MKNFIIVNRIANQRMMISMKAHNGDLSPKKRIDQKVFKTSCTAKKRRAIFTFWSFRLFCQTRKRDIPISKNRVIQTGEKIELGGVKAGLVRVLYHVGIAGVVNREPMNPAN